MNWKEKQFSKATGKALQQARKRAKMRQNELANHLGLTRTSVANMEAGRQKITLYQAALISEVLPEWAGRLTKRALDAGNRWQKFTRWLRGLFLPR